EAAVLVGRRVGLPPGPRPQRPVDGQLERVAGEERLDPGEEAAPAARVAAGDVLVDSVRGELARGRAGGDERLVLGREREAATVVHEDERLGNAVGHAPE